MPPAHMPHGWQLVYMVVRAAVAGSSSRAAHRASFSSAMAMARRSRFSSAALITVMSSTGWPRR